MARVLCAVELYERNVVVHLCPAQPPREEARERPEQPHNLFLADPGRYVAYEKLCRRSISCRALQAPQRLRGAGREPRGGGRGRGKALLAGSAEALVAPTVAAPSDKASAVLGLLWTPSPLELELGVLWNIMVRVEIHAVGSRIEKRYVNVRVRLACVGLCAHLGE